MWRTILILSALVVLLSLSWKDLGRYTKQDPSTQPDSDKDINTCPPVGIHLGPTHIYAAYINSSSVGIPIGAVEGSLAYQSFFADHLVCTYQPRPPCKDNHWDHCIDEDGNLSIEDSYGNPIPNPISVDQSHATEVFIAAFQDIKAFSEKELGHKVDIGAVVIPNYFSGTLNGALDMALEKVFGLGENRRRPFSQAAWLAYELAPSEDILVFITFEWQKTFLEMQLIYSNGFVTSIEGNVRFDGFGELDMKKWAEDHNSESSFESRQNWSFHEMGWPRRTLKSKISQFLERSDIPTIIIGGEASEAGQRFLIGIIEDELEVRTDGDVKDLVLNSVEPNYVGAIGAARWASILDDHPDATERGFHNVACGFDWIG